MGARTMTVALSICALSGLGACQVLFGVDELRYRDVDAAAGGQASVPDTASSTSPSGEPSPSTGAGGSGARESSAGGARGQADCGASAVPDAPACSAGGPWQDGPAGTGTCQLACSGANACAATTIACPPGFHCLVVCDGISSCDGSAIVCPAGLRCEVSCRSSGACSGAEVECAPDGPCVIDCRDGALCLGSEIGCGLHDCSAACDTTSPSVDVTCSPASVCACDNGC